MLLAISLTWALTFPTSLAAFVKSFDLILTLGFFGIAALRLFMPFLRLPLDAAARAIAPPAPAIAAPPATSGTFALLATLPTPCPALFPALLALSPTPPTALRTASIGVEPPPEPLLDPFELGALAFGFDFDFDELDDFGFADFAFVALGFADDFGFAAFVFEALGFAFDFGCDLGFDLLDAPALFDGACFLDFVSAIFLSPRGVPY
jgi:hypothetical protein